MTFPNFRQPDAMDCGPTCLRIVAKYYNKNIPLNNLRDLSETTRLGTSFKGLSDAAERIGFRTLGVKINYDKFKKEVTLPCIVLWRNSHFVVVYKVKNRKVYVSDPAYGLITYTETEFLENWIGSNATGLTKDGAVLLLIPTPAFYDESWDKAKPQGLGFLFKYLLPHKKLLFHLAVGLFVSSIVQLIFPFLTQALVDIGIRHQDINFVYLILLGQLFLFFGRTGVEIIRGWILLHLSARINISLISDFFIKLMNLPIAFFDIKMTGDIMQRIRDHSKIEGLLTNTSLSVLFSLFNFVVFGAVLIWYNVTIFLIFLVGTILFIAWILLFLKRRADLDYKRFSQVGQEQSKVFELINGMQEIKLQNAERQKRWSWEYLQARLYKLSMKSLALEQTLSVGSSFINELKNIIISVFTAQLVIEGQITLGMMLAIFYILGQLSAPIYSIAGFIYQTQDAKLALARISEIHSKNEEEKIDKEINPIPEGNIYIDNISFRYTGASEHVIKDLSVEILANKVNAIVGVSGSGKTTLMKILMKFYEPQNGTIKIGNQQLSQVDPRGWRDHCGVVMQEGYIFSDTIANNIAVGQEEVDRSKLFHSVEVANIKEFIESMPFAYNTKIGMEGVGLSTGQKQRILIARAVYKQPSIIFFDEATSSLDANNEKIIMENLQRFFDGRTAVIIAHRLSTVKNADQIIVMDKGRVIERGSHSELLALNGSYFHLVKNQLDLK